MGQTNDIALYRELMRRGVSEYLTQPLGPLQVIRAVGALYADPAAPFIGRQIAFVGAKGGVGASTLAHNFAWTMAENMQTATVLVDLDLAFGTAPRALVGDHWATGGVVQHRRRAPNQGLWTSRQPDAPEVPWAGGGALSPLERQVVALKAEVPGCVLLAGGGLDIESHNSVFKSDVSCHLLVSRLVPSRSAVSLLE